MAEVGWLEHMIPLLVLVFSICVDWGLDNSLVTLMDWAILSTFASHGCLRHQACVIELLRDYDL